jgi:hypothetical protein
MKLPLSCPVAPRYSGVDSRWLLPDSAQWASRRPTQNWTAFPTRVRADQSSKGRKMSVHELKTLARKHWQEHLPDKVKELRAEGMLEAATNAAANMAHDEIERLMKLGYTEHEAREVALPAFILLPPEYHEEEQDRELAEKERVYQKMMSAFQPGDPNED